MLKLCMNLTKTGVLPGNKALLVNIPLIFLNDTNPLKSVKNIFNVVGKGSYGVVVAARDHQANGELVAIKKMMNVFEHKTFARRTLR